MAEVTVDATWRLSRAEFLSPSLPTGAINGYGEVLMVTPYSKGATLFGAAGKSAVVPATMITRVLGEVAEDFIEYEGRPIKFANLVEALSMFFDKWRVEDAEKPPEQAPVSEMQPTMPRPPGENELPPPRDPANPAPPPQPIPEPTPLKSRV
jgi:hypothetical protein